VVLSRSMRGISLSYFISRDDDKKRCVNNQSKWSAPCNLAIGNQK